VGTRQEGKGAKYGYRKGKRRKWRLKIEDGIARATRV
jgi:hypothetical protein